MYPEKSQNVLNLCSNNSPEFAENIDYYSCRGLLKQANHSVVDIDGDSIAYHFDQSYSYKYPYTNLTPVDYKQGYSFNNPTPNKVFDSTNSSSQLDSLTGMLTYKINSGGPQAGEYLIVIRVDEYRQGAKIGSIFREYPIFVPYCSPGPYTPGLKITANTPGLNNYVLPSSYTVTVAAKENILLDFNPFLRGTGGNIHPETTITLSSEQFSRSATIDTLCDIPPCALPFHSSQFQFDSLKQEYKGNINGLNWQTNCNHLDSNGKAKTYQFQIKTETDLCDSLYVNTATIHVEVVPGNPEKPDLFCVNGRNKHVSLTWDTAGVSKQNFQYWSVYSSRLNGQFELVDTIETFSNRYPGKVHASFPRPDSGIFPQVFVQAHVRNCNYIGANSPSDTVGRVATASQVNDELVVQMSPATLGELTFRWAKCDPLTELPVDQNYFTGGRNFKPADSGYYWAEFISTGFCGGVTNCVYYRKPVGLDEQVISKVSIYPNPTSGTFYFDSEEIVPCNYEIRNVEGKLIQAGRLDNLNKAAINLNGPAGVYFIQLIAEDGMRLTKKLIKW
jgi:hypothetical protein